MDEQSEVVKRALEYPYAIPARSFIQSGERTLTLDAADVDLTRRIPLLAYGSNAAPQVLSRKLADAPDPVPVLKARLSDFDVVYSAHISPYGAVPATLYRSPDTQVAVFVAYLTAEQLGLISATEPNYELETRSDLNLTVEGVTATGDLRVYSSRHGCLLLEGSTVALAAVEARGRTRVAMDQTEVLGRVRDILCPDHDLATFVGDCVAGAIASVGRLSSVEAP